MTRTPLAPDPGAPRTILKLLIGTQMNSFTQPAARNRGGAAARMRSSCREPEVFMGGGRPESVVLDVGMLGGVNPSRRDAGSSLTRCVFGLVVRLYLLPFVFYLLSFVFYLLSLVFYLWSLSLVFYLWSFICCLLPFLLLSFVLYRSVFFERRHLGGPAKDG